MQRRLAVAAALLGRPALALLDEPTAHLDPASRDAVVALAADARAGGAAVVVATHEPDAFLPAVDQVVLLRAGRAVRSGAPGALLAGRPSTLRLALADAAAAADAAARARARGLEPLVEGCIVSARATDVAALLALALEVAPAGVDLASPRLASLAEAPE
jgi:ABC-2 type transport system ATP-binding protein